jgi:predicted heme/steroid binding protein
MAKYKCPSPTCNVTLEGAVYEIIGPAIWHAEGSHGVHISDTDVERIIEQQARGVGVDYIVDQNVVKIDIAKWWKKINQ